MFFRDLESFISLTIFFIIILIFLHNNKIQNICLLKGFLCTLLITGSASICGNFSPQGKSGDPKGENATNTIPLSWQNRLELK